MTFEWSPQAKQAAVEAALASHNKGLDPYSFPANHRDYAQDVMAALAPYVQAEINSALLRAAEEMEFVIADGDVAEVAAPVEGEVGRSSAVARRDSLHEEPHSWLRAYVAQMGVANEPN